LKNVKKAFCIRQHSDGEFTVFYLVYRSKRLLNITPGSIVRNFYCICPTNAQYIYTYINNMFLKAQLHVSMCVIHSQGV
jgi:hypothetical protein